MADVQTTVNVTPQITIPASSPPTSDESSKFLAAALIKSAELQAKGLIAALASLPEPEPSRVPEAITASTKSLVKFGLIAFIGWKLLQ